MRTADQDGYLMPGAPGWAEPEPEPEVDEDERLATHPAYILATRYGARRDA